MLQALETHAKRGKWRAAVVTCCAGLLGCTHNPEPVRRDLLELSTDNDDVRVAFSPDGLRALWGRVTEAGELEIVESTRSAVGWSVPAPVSFNSSMNDFDPAFSADGRTVFFFSSRSGGFGGDDLYQVTLDPVTGLYGEPFNLGPNLNSAGDEWAPAPSDDGTQLLFATDGRGGLGLHDLFISTRADGRWQEARNLGQNVNTALEDFDGLFLPENLSIVYARGDLRGEGRAMLTLASLIDGEWTSVGVLPPRFNCSSGLNFGPAASAAEPGRLFWSAKCQGRQSIDIWSARVGEAFSRLHRLERD
ncbi:MAG: hypothetical protein ABL889_00725 [Terricaulis sp.]